MGRAIHAVAVASDVGLLLRQLWVLEIKLPRPLNLLVIGALGNDRTRGPFAAFL